MTPTHNTLKRARQLSAGLVLALLCALFTLLPASASHAHAALLDTDPPSGAVLEEAPQQLTLRFNEPVRVVDNGMRLFGASGDPVTLAASTADTDVVVEVPAGLADGSYLLSWRVVSADAHPITGGLAFTVGEPSAAPVTAPSTEPDPWVEGVFSAAQALFYAGLLGFGGILIFGALVLPADAPRHPRLVRALALSALAGAAASIPLTWARQQGESLAAIVQVDRWFGAFGGDPAVAAGLVLAGCAVALAATRMSRSIVSVTITLAGVAAALSAVLVVGHTRTFGPAWLMVATDVIHVAAGAVWVGGLLGFVLFLLTARRRDASGMLVTPASVTATVLTRFSVLAATSVGVLAVSGVTLGVLVIQEWGALFGTNYGRTLLVKVGLVVVVIVIAAYNQRVLAPRLHAASDDEVAWTEFRRHGINELAILCAVITVTGTLVALSPLDHASHGDHGGGSSPAAAQPLTIALGEATATVTFDSASIGSTVATVTLTDVADNPLTSLTTPPVLSLALPDQDVGPLAFELVETVRAGTYTADVDFALPGEWTVAVAVRVSQFSEPIGRGSVTVG